MVDTLSLNTSSVSQEYCSNQQRTGKYWEGRYIEDHFFSPGYSIGKNAGDIRPEEKQNKRQYDCPSTCVAIPLQQNSKLTDTLTSTMNKAKLLVVS